MSINYNGTIKSLRDIVWGVVTDPLSQIEQITLLIFIKLLSERHNELERLKAKKLIFTGEYASYHFDSLSRLSGYELVDTTRKAVESLYKNPNIDEPIRRLYERSYLQVNDPRVLSLLINEINKIDIARIDMGDFYEHLLAILGTQKEAGQFRTPRHLIKFIVDIADPQIGERVLDPACGTAGFLTAAYTHIRDANTSQEARKTDTYLDKLNFDQKTFLLNKTIFGFDIDPKMIKFAISNLYLHNIKNPNISQHNTLTSNDSWEEKYQVILTNPPFSTPKGGVKPTDRFTLNSKRTEVLFVEYVIEHLTLNGRAGVIVPEGIIFQSGKAYKELRKWLVENNYLYAVVSLPSGVFNPYSGVKTSILFLDRERARKSDKILFCKVDNDGFDLGAQRRPIDKNDLPEILRVIKGNKAYPEKPIDSPLAYFVTKDKIIKSNDYNLTGDRYKETSGITNQRWPMVELGEVCEIFNGSRPKGGAISKGILSIGGEHINPDGSFNLKNKKYIPDDYFNKLNRGKLEIDDILTVKDGATTGKIGYFYDKSPFKVAAVNEHIFILRSDRKIIKSFYLYHILRSAKGKKELLKHKVGAAQGGINLSIKNIKIPLPPLSVQQQIVDELDGYQKIIDGAKQVVHNYRPQIKVDPDWKKVELGSVCEKITDGSHFSPPTLKSGFPYITVRDIDDDKINFKNCRFINDDYYRKLVKSGCKPQKGDVLFSKDGTVGKVAFIDFDKEFVVLSSLAILRPNKIRLFPLFLANLLKTPLILEQALGMKKGVAIRRIILRDIKTIQIPLPSIIIQKHIVSQIEEEQKLVEANKKLIQLFEQKIKDKVEEV